MPLLMPMATNSLQLHYWLPGLILKRNCFWKPETNTVHLLGRRNGTDVMETDLRHQRMSELIFNSLQQILTLKQLQYKMTDLFNILIRGFWVQLTCKAVTMDHRHVIMIGLPQISLIVNQYTTESVQKFNGRIREVHDEVCYTFS